MYSACAKQRPTSTELLQHRFIRGARKIAHLTELIERYQDWQTRRDELVRSRGNGGPPTIKMSASEAPRTVDLNNGSVTSAWSFDTIRSISTLGSVRDVRHVLNLDPQEQEEDEYDEEDEEYQQLEVERTIAMIRKQGQEVLVDEEDAFDYDDESEFSTSRAVVGTMERPRLGDLGLDSGAARSTTKIQVGQPSVYDYLRTGAYIYPHQPIDSTDADASAKNAPPSPKSGRLSRRARHDPNGTAIGDADLGTGCVRRCCITGSSPRFLTTC